MKINVIDLDKTLIPYDSFRLLVKNEILKFNSIVIFRTILRLCRITTQEHFKEKIMTALESRYDSSYFDNFAIYLYHDIDTRVLNKVMAETDQNTSNILVSASPELYVKKLINILGWFGSGSYTDESGNFIHLHGQGKIEWLKKNYDASTYNYNFAISDSSSDDELLSLFKRKLKWTLQ